jgi:3-dehydroquinate synthase II
MPAFWVDARPWNKELVTAAIESGADAILVPEGYAQKVKELAVVTVVSPDGDLRLGEDVVELTIGGKDDEQEALRISHAKTVIVQTTDWTIIPLENLIAQSERILTVVANADQAATATGILEKGVNGIVLRTGDVNEIKRTAASIQSRQEQLSLCEFEVTKVAGLAMGDRVCVDTCSNMLCGQGLLVGNSSAAMLLVHAESVENPYVAARPFRVNAGPVHAYVRCPGGKTKYLCELKAGDPVLIVDFEGSSQPAIVGRAKIEKRPLMLIEAQHESTRATVILQNAETIRLTKPDGAPISVVALNVGERVLGLLEEPGRHFGIKIDETIVER